MSKLSGERDVSDTAANLENDTEKRETEHRTEVRRSEESGSAEVRWNSQNSMSKTPGQKGSGSFGEQLRTGRHGEGLNIRV